MSGAIGRRHGGSAAEPRPERPEPDGEAVRGSNRMNHGGGRDNDAANCRTANRNTNDPTNRTINNGFRLASTLAQ